MIERRPFEPTFEAARAARRFVTGAVGALAPERRRDVALMVSELATNAVRHAGTPFTVAVEHSPGVLRVEVTDSDAAGEPRICSPDPSEPTGRGLRLVDRLADRWGVDVAPGGTKTVWFTISLDASRSTVDASAESGAILDAPAGTMRGSSARSSPGSRRAPGRTAQDHRAAAPRRDRSQSSARPPTRPPVRSILRSSQPQGG